MAQIIIEIPNAQVNRTVDAICARFGYQALINGVANPQTKQQFVKAWIVKQVKDAVREHEQTTAAATVKNDIDTNLNIT